MKQLKKFQKSKALGLIFGMILLSWTSCIDQLYDLSHGISKDMAIGGDSLSIPIGSTDTIRLGEYLTQDKLYMLKTMEDGGFGIAINDSIEPISISVDQSNLSIADKNINKTVSVDFGDFDLSSFKIPGISVENPVNLGFGDYSMVNFTIPEIDEKTSTNAGMYGYGLPAPSITDKLFNSDVNNLLNDITLPPDPGLGTTLLPIDPATVAVNATGDINYAITVPEGIKNISDVELEPGAILEVSIELSDAAATLTAGSIVPDFDISTGGLFVFETPPAGGLISFEQKDSLAITNGYKVKKTYNIVGLNMPSNPTGRTLTIAKTMETLGNIALKNASVMSNKLGDVGGMDLLVKMAIKNVTIHSMEFDIPQLNASITPHSTEIKINNTVPDQLNTINKVFFNDPATISINLATVLPEMESSLIKIESLTVDFPEQFVFEPMNGLSGHTYTLTNETFNPATGKTIQLTLKELDMSNIAISDRTINWNGVISYSGNISFDGRIKSDKIPSAESDAKMNVTFSSNMSFKSAEVTTKPISVTVPQVDIPFSFKVDTKDLVKRLNTLVMKPNTKIRIDLVKPDLPLTMIANNLTISFPEMFVFEYDYPGNNYTISDGPLPDSIVLVLKEIAINKDLENGELTIDDEKISVSGGVDLSAGIVNSLDIEAMSSKSMMVKAKTSDLSIASTSIMLNNLETSFSDSISLDIEQSGIPAQLASLDSLLLKNGAQMKIDVDISNMPDLSNPLNANVVINFPEMLMFSNGVNANNQLVINEPFVQGKLSKTIGIRGMKFDGKPLNGNIGIHEKLKYSAGVSVTSPTVNSDDLKGTEINVLVNADLQNISFSKAFGLVDPNLAPIDQTMDLGEIPEFLQNDDVVLDITKPVIALKTESNLGLPIIASVRVTPLINGVENTSAEQNFDLNIPKAITPSISNNTNFWIAPDSAGMPTGYVYIKTNIQDLFKKIPSGVKFHASVASDNSVQHFFDLGSTYTFRLGYNVTVPFAFGEDMIVKINNTLENIDPKIGEMASSLKGIEVLGEVINSIPLELKLAIVPLDADENRIAIDTVTQIINAGAYDGSAVSTSLTLKLEDPNGLLKELRAFKLLFTAQSNSTVAGAPIKPENFIKADLKVRITGGINTSSFLDKEE